MMRKIVKPIIIVGSGRCGSTVLHRLLAKHPQLMWLSGFCDRFPDKPTWNRLAVTAVSQPLLRPFLGGKIQPGECYVFWEKHAYGFAEPFRDLVRSDLTPRTKTQVLAALEPMLTPGRPRMLIKITGWPRIGFLDEFFEDAKFIHIVRDGRAVASSLLHVNFWRGWRGPQGWRAGLLSPEDQLTWESYQRSFIALAGLEWRIQMRAMEAARKAVDPQRFIEIKYETFCTAPLETCRRILEFSELRQTAEFERHVAATPLRNMSDRWRKDLTPAQQAILDDLLRDDLVRLGYDAQDARSNEPGSGQSLAGSVGASSPPLR
jgi:omega-hydroxy-beta-dihydromenaquinone-9 sulfotransferase